MTGARIVLFSHRDVNMILCGLTLLDDCLLIMETGTDNPLEGQLDAGVTIGEVVQLIARVSAEDDLGTCTPCRLGDHADCTDSWISSVNLMHCSCDEGSCGVAVGGDQP
jgi:hypothetical protein